jgi:hypothetical protein
MDQPNPQDGGRTLLDLCDDPANIDPDVWLQYYEQVGDKDKGALPFRIAQIYDAMVKAIEEGSTAEFVCAAGILTHYVFDACQPMHISYMFNGDPNGPMNADGKPLARGVHGEFDEQMVEYFVEPIRTDLPQLAQAKADEDAPASADDIKTTKDAAVAAVALMSNTVRKYANPIDIVRDFEELVDLKKRTRCEWLWDKYGDGMQQAMAEAVVLAARLWEAAWKNGNGKENIQSTDAVPEDELRDLYETKEGFLDSVNLEDIKGTMTWDDA